MIRYFVRRRLIGSAAMLASLAAVGLWAARVERRLESSSFLTGWLLLGALATLAAFQLRKKLPAPPLGNSSAWLQVHIYTALGSAGLYLLHASWQLPAGVLNSTLAALYGATFASGVLGLYWTRSLPRRLSRVGREVIYERIAGERRRLEQRAQRAVLTVVRSAGAITLGEFYRERLDDYFSTPPGWRDRLWPSSRRRKALMAELTEAIRYFSDDERKTAEELFALVREWDDLDYSQALQGRLKGWLFVHIALTYPLLLAAGLHAWTAYLFSGGTP